MLRPFLSYYGGKWRAAKSYPEPRYGTIVEPFAGGAGYSLRYPDRDVILVEKNHKVAAVWRYLIQATTDEILELPDIGPEGVDAHDLEDAERWLIGFWLNRGAASPRRRPSAWMRGGTHSASFWGPEIRERIAYQIHSIRRWQIIEGDFTDAPDIEATWFIDPPYQQAGRHYPCKMSPADFDRLAPWCRSRRGQVIVCENAGADWLPFQPHRRIKATSKGGARWSDEVVWLSDEQHRDLHARHTDSQSKAAGNMERLQSPTYQIRAMVGDRLHIYEHRDLPAYEATDKKSKDRAE